MYFIDTVNTGNDTANDTVFYLISQNNKIIAAEISQRLNISLSTVKRKIKALKDSGITERTRSTKAGQWKISSK